ncbi:MAG: ATPase domain-containing protein [Kofleriaceae bacterium]
MAKARTKKPAQRAKRARVETGIPGFDILLCSGFPTGGVYLINGSPGTGKTTVASQICFAAAARGESAVFVTLLSESHNRLVANLRSFEFFDEDKLGSTVHYLSAFATLMDRGLEGVLELVRQEVKQRSARILVIDGFVALDQIGRTAIEIKRFIHELQIQAEMTNCTVFATTSQDIESMQPERTMVDGIIELRQQRAIEAATRIVEIHKLRGSPYLTGGHSFLINAKGVTVEPRIESMYASPSREDTCIAAKATTGVERLDEILGGGLACGTTTMILGPSGSGKTTLGLHFLAGSTPEEPGVFFGVYETPPRLEHKAAEVGLDIEGLVANKSIEILWKPMTDSTIDGLGHAILEAVGRTKAKRLMIDGLDGFRRAATNPDRIPNFFTALANELRVRGVTTLYTTETPTFVGPNVEAPLTGVSALVENLIFMRFVELDAKLHRLLSVLKVRDTSYDSHVYEFMITSKGIDLAKTFSSAEQVLTGFAKSTEPDTRARSTKKRERRSNAVGNRRR